MDRIYLYLSSAICQLNRVLYYYYGARQRV